MTYKDTAAKQAAGKEYYLKHKEKILERNKKRYQEKREIILTQQKEYNEKNKEYLTAYRTEWNQKNPDKAKIISERAKKKRRQNPEKYAHDLAKSAQWRRKQKIDLMNAYGGECTCCGEQNIDFLTIDHVHGGGCAHKKSLGSYGAGGHFYAWLKIQGYPQTGEFQCLCYNCNCGRNHDPEGICPHQRAKQEPNGEEQQ